METPSREEELDQSHAIPILPMRHGNFSIHAIIVSGESPDSDPTYEAWKLRGMVLSSFT